MSITELATKAQTCQANSEFAEAIKLYDKIIDKTPTVAEVFLNKGCCQSILKQTDGALESFDKAIALNDKLASAHCNKGNVLKTKQDFAGALDCFARAAELDPGMQTAWYGKAVVLNKLAKHEQALEAADKALSLAAKVDAASHTERIFALVRLNRAAEALKDVKGISKSKPLLSFSEQHRKLFAYVFTASGIANMKASKFSKAVLDFQEADKLEPSDQHMLNIGICQEKLGKSSEALATFKKIQAKDPDNWKVNSLVGTLLLTANEITDAVAAFQAAIKHPKAAEQEEINFNLSVGLIKLGKDSEARKYLEKLKNMAPDNWIVHSLLGTVYISAEEFSKATDALSKASKIDGGNKDSTLFYNLGFAHFKQTELVEALAAFRKAVELNPKNKQAVDAVKALSPLESTFPAATKGAKPKSKNGDQVELADVEPVLSAIEAAKIVLNPQRPDYLNRPEYKSIQFGRVQQLTAKYDRLTMNNLSK